MELKDVYYLIGIAGTIVMGIIGVTASHFSLKNKVDMQEQRSDQLEGRFNRHEERFEEHSEKIQSKLEDVNDNINQVKILIERISK